MRRGIALVLFAGGTLSCENFDLRVKPEAGVAPAPQTDGGATTVAAGVVPAGALLGEKKTLFGGDCQSWATVDADGKIVDFSWSLPMTTITSIPASTAADVINFIDIPQVVKDQTLFKSIDYSFLPHGHVPVGVYDVPHWEFHVSKFSEAERNAIDCSDSTQPSADFIPPNWIVFPTCLLTQGEHAYDLSAPEYNRERFTKGNYATYYKGILGGIEPQATRDLLVTSRKDIDFNPSPILKKYGTKTLYPKALKVHWVAEFETYVWTYNDWIAIE